MSLDLKKFLGLAKQEIETKEADEQITNANKYLEHANALTITTQEERDKIKAINSSVYDKMKIYKKAIEADIAAAEAPVKRLKQKKKDFITPTDLATRAVANKVLAWDQEVQKKKDEEERIKREAAEAERARLQKIEDDKAAAIAKAEQDAAMEKAKQLEELGQKEAADKVMEQAVEIKPAPAYVAAAVEVDTQEALNKIREQEAQTGRVDYEVEVLNIHAVPNEFVKKELKLRDIKKKISDADGKISIPGVFFKKKVSAVRS